MLRKVKATIEETEQEMQRFAASLGYWPSQSEWNEHAKEQGFYSFEGLVYHTKKTWKEYRELFGFSQRPQDFNKENCVDAILKAARGGTYLSEKEYIAWRNGNKNYPSQVKIQDIFKTWNNAIQAAGLAAFHRGGHYFTSQEIENALKKCQQDLKRKFSESEYMKWRAGNPEIPHAQTVRRHLEGFDFTKQQFKKNHHEVYENRDEWLLPLAQFIGEQLKEANYQKWRKHNKAMSPVTLIEKEGSYRKAIVAAFRLYEEKVFSGERTWSRTVAKLSEEGDLIENTRIKYRDINRSDHILLVPRQNAFFFPREAAKHFRLRDKVNIEVTPDKDYITITKTIEGRFTVRARNDINVVNCKVFLRELGFTNERSIHYNLTEVQEDNCFIYKRENLVE